ncbi:MAG: dihydrolipoamide dehydrogenase [Carnobacterium sp.]|uniref:dihydrolipoamide dehydrogenase n=1 Tax=Carnobacterium sp. TaxID=48221 RepID=UPI003C73AFDD
MSSKETNYPLSWTGLKSARYNKYRSWINNKKPGICGSYVCAVLLHDLYQHQYGRDLTKERLLNGLKAVIDDTLAYKGTFPWDLRHGLNYVLKDNPDYSAKMHFVPDNKVVELLDKPDPIPVAVGTARILGSPYKNHWVLVYAYAYDREGKLFFKAYDNHGKSAAVLPASQTFGCVWLEKTKK